MKAFLESTVLTTIALGFINLTISISDAGVDTFVLNGSLEETFASFTGYDSIVKTGRAILTNHASKLLFVFRVWFHCTIVYGSTTLTILENMKLLIS